MGDMIYDWNTSWSYAQDGTACVGCEDSIHANETRKRKECTLMTEYESCAKQPRVDDPTPPDPGGAQSPLPVAAPSTSFAVAAANRLVKAGVSFTVLGTRSYTGGCTHTFKFGHESAGQHVFE